MIHDCKSNSPDVDDVLKRTFEKIAGEEYEAVCR